MSRNGGYQILDLKGVKFEDEGEKINIPGIAEEVKRIMKYKKPVILSGFNQGGEVRPDIFVTSFREQTNTISLYFDVSSTLYIDISLTDYTLGQEQFKKDDVVYYII